MRIIHTDVRKQKRLFNRMMVEFNEQLRAKFESIVSPSMKMVAENDEDMLNFRRKLVEYARKTTFERGDEEVVVALYAMLVWFNRIEEEKRVQLVESWTG